MLFSSSFFNKSALFPYSIRSASQNISIANLSSPYRSLISTEYYLTIFAFSESAISTVLYYSYANLAFYDAIRMWCSTLSTSTERLVSKLQNQIKCAFDISYCLSAYYSYMLIECYFESIIADPSFALLVTN
jgi:hypothetical protein